MKKKNVLVMALSLVLVAVISIGGTLAYLTARPDDVTNTFVGSAGITMALDEAPVDANGQATTGDRVKANNYTNIVPGKALSKDPTVHLTTIPAGGVDLYVKVTGVDSDDYTANVTMNGNWVKVGTFAGVDGLYKYNGVVTATGDYNVFNGISFDWEQDNGAATPTINNIVVKSYAIQTGVADADNLAATALA